VLPLLWGCYLRRMMVLASQSPRRKQLLEWAHISFEVVVSATDETYPSHLTVNEVPIHIATEKALAVAAQLKATNHPLQQAPILAADTIVVINDTIIGKPANNEEALATLQLLNGQQHQVITGVCLLHQGVTHCFSTTTNVYFNTLTDEQLAWYVAQYQPFDKAGAYAIQEWIGVVGIQKIEGCFYNVMGLPVSKVVQLLQQLHII